VRFVTYNIRHGRGLDQLVSTRRIAAVLATLEPDVVGLNEVRLIPRLSDQPRLLAEALGMRAVFQPNHGPAIAREGNLVLVRGDVALRSDLVLPGGLETRGCLVVDATVDGVRLLFAATHLSVGRAARNRQLDHLAATLPRDATLVLAGDLNCGPPHIAPLRAALTFPPSEPPTFSSRRPRTALDHIGWSEGWRLSALAAVPSSASDHLPLVADLELS
jgi:endonuclease/exonuclease/phosphatase family metal-dependent hydrolase